MPWRKSCVWVLNNLTHTIQGGKIGSGNKAVPWRPRAFTAHAAIDLSISLSSVTSLSSSCMEQGIFICACTVATTRENPRVDLAPDQTASILCGMIMLFPPAALCASRAHPRRGPSPNMLMNMHCAHRQTPNDRARSSPSSLSVGCVHFPPPLTTAQTNTHSRTCFLPLSLSLLSRARSCFLSSHSTAGSIGGRSPKRASSRGTIRLCPLPKPPAFPLSAQLATPAKKGGKRWE